MLTLTGTSSVANYQAALESVTYNAGKNPTNGGTDTSRTITWQVSDGVTTSAEETSSLALCFCAGTMIATPGRRGGGRAAKVGDHVLTLHGGVAADKLDRHRAEPAGRLGTAWRRGGRSSCARARWAENMPVPAICEVTKGHSLYLGGCVDPGGEPDQPPQHPVGRQARSVVIYHLELDTHDVLIADGAPAESYRDDGNRRLFQNVNPQWDHAPAPPPWRRS